MDPDDRRERDRFLKHLRRRQFDPLAPPKPTGQELLARLVQGVRDEYDVDAPSRTDQAKHFFND